MASTRCLVDPVRGAMLANVAAFVRTPSFTRRRRESITSRLTRWREPATLRTMCGPSSFRAHFLSLAGTRDTSARGRRTFARGVFGETTSMLVLRRVLVPLLAIHVRTPPPTVREVAVRIER